MCFGSKRNVDWYAFAHALITGVGATVCFYLDFFAAEQLRGIAEPLGSIQCLGPLTSVHRILPAFSMGYGLLDIIEGFRLGPDFLLHGIATFIIFTYFCENNIPEIIEPFLFMEVSTILLNILHADFFTFSQLQIVRGLFAFSFFMIRVLIAPYMLINMVSMLYREKAGSREDGECFPSSLPAMVVIFGAFFTALNYFWFYKIVRKILRTVKGTKKGKKEE